MRRQESEPIEQVDVKNNSVCNVHDLLSGSVKEHGALSGRKDVVRQGYGLIIKMD